MSQWNTASGPKTAAAKPTAVDVGVKVNVGEKTGVIIDEASSEEKSLDGWRGISPEDLEAASHVNITNNDFLVDGFNPIETEHLEEIKDIHPVKYWPDGVVYYKLSEAYNAEQRGKIAKGILELEEKTCIRLKEATNGVKNFIKIVDGEACYSKVGMAGGEQILSLSIGDYPNRTCVTPGVTMHEIMHALGFGHEQTRQDRDEFVTIHWDNILPDMQHNFQKRKGAWSLGVPYDYYSLMHYGKYDFAINENKPTITPTQNVLEEGKCHKIGQRCGVSDGDVKQIKLLYKCGYQDSCTDIQPEDWCQANINHCSGKTYKKYCKKSCGDCTPGENQKR